MITTLTLNPCIDKTVTVNEFQYGGLNRVVGTREDISGKGINVSIALHQLGEKTKCLGFNFKCSGDIMKKNLEEKGVDYKFIDVEGTLRTNIKVFDLKSRVMTEINENGHFVSKEAVEELKKVIVDEAKISDIMVFNGSVPEGVTKDIYRVLIEAVKDNGVKTILDAEGELLLEGIKAKPYFIKPNLYEFETAFNVKAVNKTDIVKIAREIIENGVEVVCVTLGKEGAVMVTQNEAWFAPGCSIKVKGVQGAGDSLVAGICVGMNKKIEIREMLRYGVAAANASLIREGTLLCTEEDFRGMLPKVAVEKILI